MLHFLFNNGSAQAVIPVIMERLKIDTCETVTLAQVLLSISVDGNVSKSDTIFRWP